MSKVNVRDRNKNEPGKKPNWEYRFEAAKVEGKRKHISKAGFRTKKEALEAGTKALAEYNEAGLHFEPAEISVADYLDYWFEQYVKVNLKYNTQENYKRLIEGHLKPRFGLYKLKALSASVVQEYANDLKRNGYSKSHVVGIITTLSGALDYAIEPLHYIRENPVRFVRIPKIEKEPRKRIILEYDEWEKIINYFPFGNRFHIALMIGFYTGLRIGEVTGLTWDDIDLEKNELKVTKQAVKRRVANEKKQAWYFGSPKTKSSARTVKFGKVLADTLRKEKVRQTENELKYGDFYTIHVVKNELDEKGNQIQRIVPMQKCVNPTLPRVKMVCIDENGEFTSSDSFKYCSKTINYTLNINFDFHSLRHTHATRLLENGANIKDVQIRLGHEKIETTLQTYVHNTETMAERSVEVFDQYVSTCQK